jgi:hypothetical protein
MAKGESIKISVTFTGICAFVEHQGGVTVVIPNATVIKGVTYGGEHAHVPSHIPFLEYKVKQPGLSVPPPRILFSYRHGGQRIRVVKLAEATSGSELTFFEADKGKFSEEPLGLNWSGVVEMERVIGAGYPIDGTLMSKFDPRSDRVAVRMPIPYGSINPVPQNDVYATFVPPPDSPYSGLFVQEVRWDLTYTSGEKADRGVRAQLLARPFGTTPDSGDIIVDFQGKDGDKFAITIGNAPFEDIIRKGTRALEIVDHHFATYYELLIKQPPVMRLPHRASEKLLGTRTGGDNCPPVKLTLR